MIEIKRRLEGKWPTERQRKFVLALFQTCDVEIKLNQSTFNSTIDDVMSRDEKQGKNFLVPNPNVTFTTERIKLLDISD